MAKYLTKRQKAFCKYFIQMKDPYDAAIKAGYKISTAKSHSYGWLKDPYIQKYIKDLEKYNFNAYIQELDRVIELAFAAQNPATLIKAIEAKGKAFGFDKLTISDLGENPDNLIKEDLFKKIQEKADVFEKLEKDNIKSDLSDNNS